MSITISANEASEKIVVNKELAQCLAFAYFAAFPNTTDPNHANNFYYIYTNQSVLNKTRPYLSQSFAYDKLASFFEITQSEKKGTDQIKSNVKKVYLVAKKTHDSRLFAGGMGQYKYLDQNDKFYRLIKNTSLDNIRKALGISYKSDVLSAVDIFVVKKSAETKIANAFIKYFSSPDIIIKNAVSGGKNYKNVNRIFMDSGELYPISLKLPTTITGNIHIKKVDVSVNTEVSVEIDPYTKFLALILEEPNNSRELINKVINIQFSKFDSVNYLNWVLPVTFKYTNLIDKDNNKPLIKYDLNFNLYAQGYAAGWNGQFDKSTKNYQATQWVGGVATETFETFARRYPEYDSVISKLVAYRLSIFDRMAKRLKDERPEIFSSLHQKYTMARSDIAQRHILVLKNKNKATKDFFNSYQEEANLQLDGGISLFSLYCIGVIEEIRNKIKSYDGEITLTDKIIEAHYGHAQIAFFMYMGGQNYDLYFKQRMFMTIFGAITKKAHKLIGIDDYKGMRDIIREDIELNGRKFSAEFSTPPHYIIS